jgi:hypothetical protein
MEPARPRAALKRDNSIPAPSPPVPRYGARMRDSGRNEKNSDFLKCAASNSLERNEANQINIDMMNLVLDKSITETPELTGQFMVFPNGFGGGDAEKTLSRMSREQLAAFLNAEAGNLQSAHFTALPADPTPPAPEKGLAVGVLKQAAYDLRRYRTATKPADRDVYLDAHSWITAYDSSWPYSFMNVCKLLDLCPEIVRAELMADAKLGPFHYWIRRAGRLSRKVSSSVARVLDTYRNPEVTDSKQNPASI